jgi:RimJ/RimL family protein N-acetyltransferase
MLTRRRRGTRLSGGGARHSCFVPPIAVPTLTDGSLTLRPPRAEDVDDVTAACQDPEIQRWTLVPRPYRREDAVEWIGNAPAAADAGQVVSVIAFEGDRLVGSFSVLEIDQDAGYGEIGYWVAPGARRRGVATRATRLLHDWAAGTLGLSHLEILPHEDNGPSRRVAERAGYVDTGERRAAARGDSREPHYAVYAWRRDGSHRG